MLPIDPTSRTKITQNARTFHKDFVKPSMLNTKEAANRLSELIPHLNEEMKFSKEQGADPTSDETMPIFFRPGAIRILKQPITDYNRTALNDPSSITPTRTWHLAQEFSTRNWPLVQ